MARCALLLLWWLLSVASVSAAPPAVVETAPVVERTLGLPLERPGTLAYRRLLRVHVQEAGQVERLPYYEGDRVRRGDLLLELDARLLRSEIRKAEADLRLKQRRLTRLEKLKTQNAASIDEVAEARTELEVARAELEILRTRLGFTRITAPFDGLVLERLAEPGDALARFSRVLTLADPDSLVVRFQVDGTLLGEIQAGGKVDVRHGPLRFEARVHRIHPKVDPKSRLGTVEAAFDTPPAELRAGDYVRVALTTRPRPRRLIPFRALRVDRKGEYVFVAEGGKARRQPVRSGRRLGLDVEILEGLEPGQQVITRGFLGLRNDASITISPTKGAD